MPHQSCGRKDKESSSQGFYQEQREIMARFHLILVNPANSWPTQPSCVARAPPPCHTPAPVTVWGGVGLSHWLQEAPAIIQFLTGRVYPPQVPSLLYPQPWPCSGRPLPPPQTFLQPRSPGRGLPGLKSPWRFPVSPLWCGGEHARPQDPRKSCAFPEAVSSLCKTGMGRLVSYCFCNKLPQIQ